MNENKKVFFIINKYSGTGFKQSLEGRIIDFCAAQKWEAVLEYTRHRGHATQLAQQAVMDEFNLVVAVGGDGTVNETAQGLLNNQTPLAILPKGSGNGLARHLGIPMSIPKALDSLAESRSVAIDGMLINGRWSFNVSGIGFDGHVAGLFEKDRRRGLIGYTKLTLREFVRFKEFKGRALIDGKTTTTETFLIAIANSSQFGNNARIAPKASVTDGLMELTLLKKIPVASAIGFARKMFDGTLDQSRFVTSYRAARFVLDLEHPMAYHIDGEACGSSSHFDVEIKPAALKAWVPMNSKNT
jgi:YegS/Rv2252/BmrU family lipid kinase